MSMPVEGMVSEMDFFTTPLVAKQIEWAEYVKHQPVAPVQNSEVIEFIINPIRDQYIDLSKTKVYIKGKVINSASSQDLAADEPYAPVNLLANSLFKQCNVTFNDKHVSSGAQTFAHTSYLETLTSYNKGTKETSLQAAGYFEDSPGKFEEVNDFSQNDGAEKRRNLSKSSKSVEMIFKLHSPVFNVDKCIPGNVKINVKLTRSPPEFYMMRKAAYGTTAAPVVSANLVFNIQSIYLKVFKVKPVNNVFIAQQSILLKTPAKYVLPYVDTKIFTISQGFSSISFDNIFLDLVPSRILLVMVDADAMNGSYLKNPYNFKHNNINHLVLVKDGVHHPPEGYQPDFTNGARYLECYQDFMQCLDFWGRNKNNGITPKMYLDGFTIFAWDLTPDKSAATSNFNQPMSGTLRLEMKFKTNLTSNVNVFVYGESKNMMEIDINGITTLDHERRKNMY